MARVQILSWAHFFFLFYHYLFHNSFLCFSNHLLSFLPHFLNVYCGVHTENLLCSDILELVIFVANVLVIGILENFHIGTPLAQCNIQAVVTVFI